jgi:hypothetical protein
LQHETFVVLKPEEGAAVLEDWQGCIIGTAVEGEEGKRRLAPVVGEEEIRGSGEASPEAENRSAPKDVLGRKAEEDLPLQDVTREGGGGGGDAAAARPRRCSWRRFRGSGLLITAGRCRALDYERYNEEPAAPPYRPTYRHRPDKLPAALCPGHPNATAMP